MTGRPVALDFIPNFSLASMCCFTDGVRTVMSYPKEIPLDPTHFNMTQTWHSNLGNLYAESPSISLFSKMGDLGVAGSGIPVTNLSPIRRGITHVLFYCENWVRNEKIIKKETVH